MYAFSRLFRFFFELFSVTGLTITILNRSDCPNFNASSSVSVNDSSMLSSICRRTAAIPSRIITEGSMISILQCVPNYYNPCFSIVLPVELKSHFQFLNAFVNPHLNQKVQIVFYALGCCLPFAEDARSIVFYIIEFFLNIVVMLAVINNRIIPGGIGVNQVQNVGENRIVFVIKMLVNFVFCNR